jgi:hypothetical protein
MERDYCYASKNTSAGVVELGTTLRMFYTSTSGSPDMLFTVLLASAREAYVITSAVSQHAHADERAAGLAAETYLAGLLLRDASFVPARVSPDCGHHYSLNLVKGEMRLKTEVYAVTGGRTSLLSVTLKGPIAGNEFEVLNTNSQPLLALASEDDIKKPNFFRDELPRLACQPGPQQGGVFEDSQALIDQAIELHLVIPTKDVSHAFVVKKGESANQAEVHSAETGNVVGKLGLGCLRRLIRAGLNRMKTSSPCRTDGHLSCFLDLLPIILQESETSDTH